MKKKQKRAREWTMHWDSAKRRKLIYPCYGSILKCGRCWGGVSPKLRVREIVQQSGRIK